MLIRVKAENTSSGNPQRGWIHVNDEGDFISFIDEGYLGDEAINPLLKKVKKKLTQLSLLISNIRNYTNAPMRVKAQVIGSTDNPSIDRVQNGNDRKR